MRHAGPEQTWTRAGLLTARLLLGEELQGIEEAPVGEDLVVKVIARGPAGVADMPDDLTTCDLGARLDAEVEQVPIARLEAEAVVDHHQRERTLAVRPEQRGLELRRREAAAHLHHHHPLVHHGRRLRRRRRDGRRRRSAATATARACSPTRCTTWPRPSGRRPAAPRPRWPNWPLRCALALPTP